MDSKLSWNDLKAIIKKQKLEKLKRSVRASLSILSSIELISFFIDVCCFYPEVVRTGTSISSKYIIYQEAF